VVRRLECHRRTSPLGARYWTQSEWT